MPTTQTFRLLLAAALCADGVPAVLLRRRIIYNKLTCSSKCPGWLMPSWRCCRRIRPLFPLPERRPGGWRTRAVVQSAAIARDNRTVLFGWLNNILVNSNLRDRGLRWQVQQDLYRDLRRRPVKYFRIGLTIRDRGTGREHSCVYVNAAGKGLQGPLFWMPGRTAGIW